MSGDAVPQLRVGSRVPEIAGQVIHASREGSPCRVIKPVGRGIAPSFNVASHRGGQPVSECVRVLFGAADPNDSEVLR